MQVSGHSLNILRCYFQASKDEIEFGLRWYRLANEEIASRLDVPIHVGCGIVAALSPQTAWEANISKAERFLDSGTGSTGVRINTAREILSGVDPLDALTGPKTNAFYRCLMNIDDEAVCVDGHAFSCWHGTRFATSKAPRMTARQYATIAEDYRSAASAVNVIPHQMQAITWLAWRRLHPLRKGRKKKN